MDRIVRTIQPVPGTEEEPLRSFSEFSGRPNVVLLGDPGAGKTHLFREFAASSGGRYVTARAFLVTPARSADETLFIDGLDERRAGRGDRDTVDALVERLFAVAPRKVRISCRAADWLGESDLASLRPYFELSGEPVVLGLEKLSEVEQRAVLSAHGMTADGITAFLREAEERGLDEFLENPQNLIMLLSAVRSGEWPPTRKALFELSTKLMLQEAHPEHARTGGGVYSVDELRPVAGAICAARLISDVEAVGLSDQEGSDAIPSYRSLRFFPPEQVRAALGRRVFVAGPAPESADYAHRTLAEYLGAAWLADTVRAGFPFARLQALLGVDGHPAPELRGLHAWLVVHLPEYSDRLIAADAYGVLTYGDAASLTPSSCAFLIRALGHLSETDPWFRNDKWQLPAIGALARPDMVDEFRTVLQSPASGFGIRSIIVEALAAGTPLPALKDDMADVLAGDASAYRERAYALTALRRMGPEGKEATVCAYRQRLGSNAWQLRLRAEILTELYDDYFGPGDVVQLLTDMLSCGEQILGGTLWLLHDKMPLPDIAAVLDGLAPVDSQTRVQWRNGWEVGAFYQRILLRAWSAPAEFDAVRALRWLRVRLSFSGTYRSGQDELRAALRSDSNRLHALADHFLESFVPGDMRWLDLSRFREVTLFEISADDFLDRIVAHLARAVRGSEKELFFYEVALSSTYAATAPHAQTVFADLFALADMRSDFLQIRERCIAAALPERYLGRADEEEEHDPEQQRRDFERDAETIRTGIHAGWLGFAAKIYFALFEDVDQAASPHARLSAILGEANTQIALEGFGAALTRPDVPTLNDVAALSAERRLYDRWFAVIAGMSEIYAEHQQLGQFPDELLRAALAFDLTNPIPVDREGATGWLVHLWKTAALEERPDLVRDAYVAVARAHFRRGSDHVDGVYPLLNEATFASFRTEILLTFLREFPNTSPHRLDELLQAAIATPEAHVAFLDIARGVLAGNIVIDERQRDMWLTTAYVLSPSNYETELEACARARSGLVFQLRDRTGFQRRRQEEPGMQLTLPQLEFLARLTGSLHPAMGRPTGGSRGDTNGWDATEYFDALVNAISALPSEAATGALVRLEADAQLSSYRSHLRHALANQRARRREAEYDRPNWPRTVTALANSSPATVADLHALVVAHLDELKKRIAAENTDLFKAFWNIDRYARLTEPRPEEACRDTLVTHLRPSLAPLGVTVEPEGHMAADRRADISVAMPGRKILCELKRDYHADVWTAAEEQLDRFYTHDPEAQGFGVYVVFWFGENRPSSIPALPRDPAQPRAAAEMEQMLRALLPADREARLAVVVIDVSGVPAVKR